MCVSAHAHLAGLFRGDLLGDEALFEDVHHLPTKIDHLQVVCA